MKRVGNLIPLICTRENISKSIDVVLRGNKRKKTKTAKYILSHREETIDWVIKVISTGTFKIGAFRHQHIVEGYKDRDIQILNYKDRIVANAIITVLDDILVKRMIFTTASSIKDRGAVYLKDIIQRDLRKHPKQTQYAYKIDINKYYHNIDHDLMKKCIRRFIKDKTLLPILDNFIDMLPEGLSIGLRASQVFGNLLLSWLLDCTLKSQLGVKFYYRYCDDIVILGPSKAYLWQLHHTLEGLLKGTGLSIKSTYRIYPVDDGIDFLGFVVYSGIFCRVRKRIKKKAQTKLSHIKSKHRRQEVIAGIKGYCLHSNGHHLFNTLLYG